MDEKVQNDLEESLRKYISLINDPSKNRKDIEAQDAILRSQLGILQSNDQVLSELRESKDINIRGTYQYFAKQVEEAEEAFNSAMEKIEQDEEALQQKEEERAQAEKAETEQKQAEKTETEKPEEEQVQAEKSETEEDKARDTEEIRISADTSDTTNDDTVSDANIEEDIQALEEKAEELKKAIASVYDAKEGQLKKCEEMQTILSEKAAYEARKDEMNELVANHIITKTILAEKRAAIMMEIGKQIELSNSGKTPTQSISELQNQVSAYTNEINDMENTFAVQYDHAQRAVKDARKALDYAVAKKVEELPNKVISNPQSALSNRYEEKLNYSEEGVLKSKYLSMTKNSENIKMLTVYDGSLTGSISEYRFAKDGRTVRIMENSHGRGVETGYYMGNEEMANNDVGAQGMSNKIYSTTDYVKEEPDLTASLNHAGIDTGGDFQNTIDSIEEAQEVIDEQANNNKEVDNEMEYPTSYQAEDDETKS